MSAADRFVPGCSFIVGVHGEPPWIGFEQPCGSKDRVERDARQERYDIVLCRHHREIERAAQSGETDE